MSPDDRRFRLALWGLTALAAVRYLGYAFFTPDDTYIYLRFARNLLERGEASFNPGEPTWGFTSVLWLLAISALGAVLRDLPTAAKTLSLLASLAVPATVARLVERWSSSRRLALLAGLAMVAETWMARWSVSGLEAGLAALLPVAVVLWSAEARAAGRVPWRAALVAGLAPFVRPEMIGLALLFAAHGVLAESGPASRRLRRAAGPAALCLGTAGVGLFALWLAFGRIVPNTAPAKGALEAPLAALVPSLMRIGRILASTTAVELAILVAALGIGIATGRRARWLPDGEGRLLALAWCLGLVGLYAVRGVTVYTRYLLPVIPLVVAGGFAALVPLWRRGGRAQALGAALAGLAILPSIVLDAVVVRPATMTYQRSEEDAAGAIGRWLARNSAPDDVVAAWDIGAIGWYSRRRILDLNALVSPELLEAKRRGTIWREIERRRPEWLVDVDPDPRRAERELRALAPRLVMPRPFEKMFVLQDRTLWYTLWDLRPREETGEDTR
ncbi:MAG: hypothetical protein D6738_15035 [Acidobacteria bacterium]|nr:MAG: hypothetical protein D6738_15035 [Acidobacteriota bacterium]